MTVVLELDLPMKRCVGLRLPRENRTVRQGRTQQLTLRYACTAIVRAVAGVLAFLLGMLCCRLSAGPPLRTDDPQTLRRGERELNLSHNIERTRRVFFMEAPLVDINYGFRDNDQWKIEFPVLFVDPADSKGHWGVGDILLGWRHRFLDEDEAPVIFSVYPQVLTPTGNARLGLGGGHTELFVPLEIGKHFFDEKLFLYAEIGYNSVFGDSSLDEIIYGVAAEWQATKKLQLLGEVGGNIFPRGGDADDVIFNLGCRYELNDNVKFMAAFGRSFRDRRHDTPELLTYVGFQITWGGDRKNSNGESNE